MIFQGNHKIPIYSNLYPKKSFTSNIVFLDKGAFIEKSSKIANQVNEPWGIEQSIRDFDTACTQNVSNCVAGAIKDKLIFHFKPKIDSNQDYFDFIKKFSDKADNKSEELSCLIIGAKHGNYDVPELKASRQLAFGIVESLNKFSKNLSYFIGQELPDFSHLIYEKASDTYFVYSSAIGLSRESVRDKVKKLIKRYRYIKISDQDKVFIGDTEITPIIKKCKRRLDQNS